METSSNSVLIWWGCLCGIAAFNLALLGITWRIKQKRHASYSAQIAKLRNWQFVFAAVYTLGCGFRSILPRGDIRRIVMVDHWISAIAIGRSVATIAELAFVAQWSLILYEIGSELKNRRIILISKVIVPMIVVAECFSWYACVTTNYIGTVVEESLWAVAAGLTVFGFLGARGSYSGSQKKLLWAGILSGIVYVIYMITVDVPNYLRGWLENKSTGKQFSSISEGLVEVATQWRFTRAHEDWQYEMIWMTLYFSVAVWMSIYIVNAPRMDRQK